jgi:hypothetical protein
MKNQFFKFLEDATQLDGIEALNLAKQREKDFKDSISKVCEQEGYKVLLSEIKAQNKIIDKLKARVVELEKQLNTLLESQLWGVNCKPSGTDWLTKEDREKLLHLSYSLDYVQYATSADFIRSLLARLTPPEVRE